MVLALCGRGMAGALYTGLLVVSCRAVLTNRPKNPNFFKKGRLTRPFLLNCLVIFQQGDFDDTVLLVVENLVRLQHRVGDAVDPRVLRGDGLAVVVTVGAEAPGGDVLADVVDLPVQLDVELPELLDRLQGGLVGILDDDRVDAAGVTAGLIDTAVEGLGGLLDGLLGGLSRPHQVITAGLVGQLDDLIQTLEGLDDVFAAVDRLCGDLGQRLLIVHGRSFFRAAIQPLLLVGLLPPAGWQQ